VVSKARDRRFFTEGFRFLRRESFAQATADLDDCSKSERQADVAFVFVVVSVLAVRAASPADTRNGCNELVSIDQITELRRWQRIVCPRSTQEIRTRIEHEPAEQAKDGADSVLAEPRLAAFQKELPKANQERRRPEEEGSR